MDETAATVMSMISEMVTKVMAVLATPVTELVKPVPQTPMKETEMNSQAEKVVKAPKAVEAPAGLHNVVAQMSNPFRVESLRWALSRLGAPTSLDLASLLIDEWLRVYDSTHGRWIDQRPLPICFGPCSPNAGCVGNFESVEIRHLPNGQWGVNGVAYPANRIAAERAAQKIATLRTLARELGIPAEGLS